MDNDNRKIHTTVLGEVFMFLFISSLAQAVAGQDLVPEVSALKGSNQTIRCAMNATDPGRWVLWKKISQDGSNEDIVRDNNRTVTHPEKYQVDPPDGLVLIFVDVEDEGIYQCEAQGQTDRTRVRVLVPAANITVTAALEDEKNGRRQRSVTCRAQHARPPAAISWYRGAHDITATEASSYSRVYTSNGYGDSESMLHVGSEWRGALLCVASIGDHTADKTAVIFVGAASHQFLTPALVIWASAVHLVLRVASL